MKNYDLSNVPIVLELNRVERLYTGGLLLDRWQGLYPEKDSSFSEEFIISTVEYKGPGNPTNKGLSQTKLSDGSLVNLVQIINSDRLAYLGQRYAEKTSNQSGVLCRVGDSNVRLVIQCHPDELKAKEILNFQSGKTEAWYIADTREINGVKPYIYCGFKKGVTKELWTKLFNQQDIQGMLNCMHRIDVKVGEVYVIEAGMPHAMGSGCLFIEIHEPCDYTIRVEKNYSTKTLTDEEMHYGLGFEAMLDFFSYKTYDANEIDKKYKCRPNVMSENDDAILTSFVTYDHTDRFMVDKLVVKNRYSFDKFDGHYIIITLKNEVKFACANHEFTVPQGRGIFVPANVDTLTIEGNCEVIIAYPFKTE
jgi:mannose-6-phosphate isomerase